MALKKGLPRTAPNGMRMLPAAQRFTIADTPGIYHHSAGIVSTPDGLVCVYRTSDQHVASWSSVNMARSTDGGRTWGEHRTLSESSFAKDKANWVAPQTSRLPNGRILVIIDRGNKKTPFDWPMLSQWQMPDRGMSNWLLESADNGKTWFGPRQIDSVGGEPSYIVGLSNGSLLYTRTDSAPTTAKKNPSKPWGPNYYKSTAVFSDDNGKTFARTVPLFDDPLVGDCEVGVVEYAPGKLLAISRIGDGGSGFNQPSRIAYSDDYGKTWSKPRLSPVYAHRPCVGKLAARGGKFSLLMTFRNASNGTTRTCAWAFEPEKDYGYQPNVFVWEEERCRLERDGLHLRTEEGTARAVQFSLYPIEDDDSSCEFEATFAVKDADTHGCVIGCGTWVRFEPHRVSLADRPADGFDLDATVFHTYRLVAENHRLQIWVDGALRLDASTDGIFNHNVRWGNQRGATPNTTKKAGDALRPDGGGYTRNRSYSIWKAVKVHVKNRRDHSVQWEWEARSGKYPDQFRRDRLILLERNGSFSGGNSGYSGWAQMSDGTVVVADYTCTEKALPVPLLRAYRLAASDL